MLPEKTSRDGIHTGMHHHVNQHRMESNYSNFITIIILISIVSPVIVKDHIFNLTSLAVLAERSIVDSK